LSTVIAAIRSRTAVISPPVGISGVPSIGLTMQPILLARLRTPPSTSASSNAVTPT
jgi:hypothetical protein